MKSLYDKFMEASVNALKEIKKKRIIGGMDLFHVQKEYVLISKEDYSELLNKVKELES